MCAYTGTFCAGSRSSARKVLRDSNEYLHAAQGPRGSGCDRLKAMTKQERIAGQKRQLDDANEWLEEHRDMQRQLPNYEKNREAAHELRKQFWKLKDPDYYARVYA